jgi:DNA-binding PadR family transcriptional regulator
MPKPRDKRRRKDLDAFVLALIEGGVSTPYELQQQAGLSPGATIPALARLLEAGNIRQTKPEARGRVAHKVTAAGKRSVATAWRRLIDDGPSGNLEADLRVALLALLVGEEPQLAAEFLRTAAEARVKGLDGDSNSQKSTGVPAIAALYSDLRHGAANKLLRAEAEALLAIAASLPPGAALDAKGIRTLRKAEQQATKRSKTRE